MKLTRLLGAFFAGALFCAIPTSAALADGHASNEGGSQTTYNQRVVSRITLNWGKEQAGINDALSWGRNTAGIRDINWDYKVQTTCNAALENSHSRNPGEGAKVVGVVVGVGDVAGRQNMMTGVSKALLDQGFTRELNRWWTAESGTASWGIYSRISALYSQVAKNNDQLVCITLSDSELGKWVEESESQPKVETVKESVPIQVLIDVTAPMNSVKNGEMKDPIGANNLHNQSLKKDTSFFKLVSDVWAGKYKGVDELRAAVDSAKNAEKSASYLVDLDQANKDGMAEGGILNVSQRANFVDIQSSEVYERTRTCEHYYVGGKKIPNKTRNCSAWGPWKTVDAKKASATAGTPKAQKFYQMLSVHCNAEGFADLVKRLGGNAENVKNDGVGGKFFGSLTTKPGDDASTAAFIKKGDKEFEVGFYDKECPLVCTPDSVGLPEDSAAAKTVANSVPQTSPSQPMGGAYAKDDKSYSGRDFEIFRDGEPNKISVNLWRPVSIPGVVDYQGEAAVTTTISRWNGGTPGVAKDSEGGRFVLSTGDSKITSPDDPTIVFTGEEGNAPTQRNWNASTGSGSTWAIVKGQKTDFLAASTWASESGRPQAFNFKWEFEPKMATEVFTRVGVVNPLNPNPVLTEASRPTAKIQGKCYAGFGPEAQADTTSLFAKNTGTGSTNGLDGVLLGGDNLLDRHALTITTVRSTTE